MKKGLRSEKLPRLEAALAAVSRRLIASLQHKHAADGHEAPMGKKTEQRRHLEQLAYVFTRTGFPLAREWSGRYEDSLLRKRSSGRDPRVLTWADTAVRTWIPLRFIQATVTAERERQHLGGSR